MSIVVAYASNRAIGRGGALPWRLPSDLRRFRELTTGGTVVMGRKTFQSLPEAHRPLRERRNLVLSSKADLDVGAAEVHASLDGALQACGEDCFVIGGAAVYEQALPRAERVYATHVEAEPQADAFFPQLAPAEWRCVQQSEPLCENGLTLVFRTYDRVPHANHDRAHVDDRAR